MTRANDSAAAAAPKDGADAVAHVVAVIEISNPPLITSPKSRLRLPEAGFDYPKAGRTIFCPSFWPSVCSLYPASPPV